MDSPMGGIFNAPNKNFRPPMMQSGGMPSAPTMPGNSRIMPPGNAMGGASPTQNSFMPQGAPMGPGMPGSDMPAPTSDQMPPPDQTGQPTSQAPFSMRAPIMDPNNNFKLDALKAGVLNPQTPTTSVGTPTQNTPATNMQQIPFMLNQLRSGANSPAPM